MGAGAHSAVTEGRAAGAIHAYWRAANYLGAAQVYLRANVLVGEPLRPEHIKPRLLGHWGTVPGINFVYAHLNRLIPTGIDSLLYSRIHLLRE